MATKYYIEYVLPVDVLRFNRGLNLTGSTTFMTSPTPVEGDIIRMKGHARYTDGYYVMNSAGSWVAMTTW